MTLILPGAPCGFTQSVTTASSDGSVRHSEYRCGKPPEHHHKTRNILGPPSNGGEWSADSEYYPNHDWEPA